MSQISCLFFIRWPYGPFLRDASLPGFPYCLKYPGFGCLHCAGRSLCDIHESYREQSRRLLMLSNRSGAYLGVFFDRCAAMLQVKRTNKHVRIFASLWSFSVDLTFSHAAPRLVDYVQYLHVIGQTTLDDLGNIKILARTCPVWTGTYGHPTFSWNPFPGTHLGKVNTKCE